MSKGSSSMVRGSTIKRGGSAIKRGGSGSKKGGSASKGVGCASKECDGTIDTQVPYLFIFLFCFQKIDNDTST